MPEWLTSLITSSATRQGIGMVGMLAIGVYLIYSNWSKVKPYIPLINKDDGEEEGDVVEIPTRREVLDNLDACYDYFEDIGCKEGMDAINIAVNHTFHERLVEPPPVNTVDTFVRAVTDALKPKPDNQVNDPPLPSPDDLVAPFSR